VKRCAVLLLAMVAMVDPALGHEVRPASLEITEGVHGRFDIVWKQPSQETKAVRLTPHISGITLESAPRTIDAGAGFLMTTWRDLDLGVEGVKGRRLWIEGLEMTITDVVVNLNPARGDSTQAILHPRSTSLVLGGQGAGLRPSRYVLVGIEHILTGFDHLAFILGLVLLVRQPRTLIITVTAFTAAHSLTLVAAALRIMTPPVAIIESLVALSIVFVAVELIRGYQGTSGVATRHPGIVAFAFGLLHGVAFAGALAQIGLPADAVVLSLLLFNLGVELGQVMFIAFIFLIAWPLSARSRLWTSWLRWVPPYAIGGLSTFWFVERLASLN
jgi:hydrogenase/urease accessory protein HupE